MFLMISRLILYPSGAIVWCRLGLGSTHHPAMLLCSQMSYAYYAHLPPTKFITSVHIWVLDLDK